MNKITTTAGLVALSAASIHAAVFAPQAGTPGAQKPWSVSATLRGFYDDNYATAPKGPFKRDSFGFEVSPSASLNLIREQTTLGLSYLYSMRYYEDRPRNMADHMHQANAKLSHAFSERYKADVSDSFVIAQEPTLLDPTAVVSIPLRSEGSNMRNTVQASFTAGITENLQAVLGYQNNWYDYEDENHVASRSALLDRVEHLGTINLRQVLLPKTVGVLGYQYGVTDYNSKDPLGFTLAGTAVSPNIRDNDSHYVYIGVDQGFTPTLNVAVRGGVQYTEYNNAKNFPGAMKDTWSPYADANATWTYTEGSYAQLGVRHTRTATDVGLFGVVAPTLDAEATTVYGSVNHRFGRLVGSLLGQWQRSTFEGGLANSQVDNFYLAGVNLSYEINKFIAAEAGYNFDKLDSDLDNIGIPRSYTRNRVYIGIRATY